MDQDDNAYIYRELYVRGKTYSQLCQAMLDLMADDEKIEVLVADPALQAKSADT